MSASHRGDYLKQLSRFLSVSLSLSYSNRNQNLRTLNTPISSAHNHLVTIHHQTSLPTSLISRKLQEGGAWESSIQTYAWGGSYICSPGKRATPVGTPHCGSLVTPLTADLRALDALVDPSVSCSDSFKNVMSIAHLNRLKLLGRFENRKTTPKTNSKLWKDAVMWSENMTLLQFKKMPMKCFTNQLIW